MPVAHDSRISNGNRTEWSPIRSVIIRLIRLQNSPYFCGMKYAQKVKQKVWNEAENRERDWGETLKIRLRRRRA